jgi:hypothetical protein
MDKSDILQDISVELSKSIKKHLQHIKQLPSADKKQIEKLISNFKDGLDDLSEANINEASIAFVNDKLIGDRIQKSGLLPLLGDNNKSLSSDKMKFTRELSDTLKKLYKKYSSLDVK